MSGAAPMVGRGPLAPQVRRAVHRAGRQRGGAVSDVVGQYARVEAAYAQPTLTLLHGSHAPVTVALLRACFSRETTTIETARMHQLVDNHLVDLRNDGHTVPDRTGRELCQKWVKDNWLGRDQNDDGTQVYALTSHAQSALNLVDSLEHGRPTLSKHRITTILDTVRNFNAEVNPSRQARVNILGARISELVAERDRLEQGGEIEPVSVDRVVEGFTELLRLVNALPSDFQRVTEQFERIRQQILDDFRSEARPPGEVIDSYLERANAMGQTAEGKAFDGAFALLGNDALLLQLRQDLDALLNHPHAEALTAAEKRELRSTVQVVRRGLDDVLTQWTRASKAIKDYVTTHDVVRDRQLDQTLRQLDREFGPWLARTGVRTRVPIQLLPETLDIDYLPRRFHDPASAAPPPPLAETAEDPAAVGDHIADLIAWGGPSIAALTEAVDDARANGSTTVGDVFTTLEVGMRRPADVLGLFHVADATLDATADHTQIEEFEAIRPDGTSRVFVTARTTLPATMTPEHTP
ncbi:MULTISPECIES: DUF3375 domain-containing protein [Isoptericola]|uniref:DUF3375 family protein n=2 Tax=Isoptericola TaxID=254250 RepID=UPI000D065675